MSLDPDDLTPRQRGQLPTDAEVLDRREMSRGRLGGWAIFRTLAMVALALLVMVVVVQLRARTR